MTNKSLDEIKNFTFPSLVEGSEWYIKFYAFDPVQNKMRRKKIKLNHIKKIGDRRKYAQYLLKKLTRNLENGWNPWIEEENRKAYCSFSDACTHYRRHIAKQLDEGLLREDTYRSYISQLKNIEGWNARRKEPIVYIFNFDRGIINEFLEYIYIERKNTAQTRNNYLTFIRLFCSFLMEQQYVKTKPSDCIK